MNYQKELEGVLAELPDKKGTLLLHSCCAPCSSYVLEYLRKYFQITVFYYNPNISEEAEYRKRVEEEKRLIMQMNRETGEKNQISFLEGNYDSPRFFEAVKGLEQCKEGGERCEQCFRLRLMETAKIANEKGFDFFTTTLTISPLKNAELINQIGRQITEKLESEECQSILPMRVCPQFLPSDFKKKNGYKRSLELSREYDLYRQDYCGCIFSKMQREQEKTQKESLK